jgi:hypothetical protein
VTRIRTTARRWTLFGVLVALALLLPLVLAAPGSSATAGADDFNRADGGLGVGWSAMSDGALSISSQAVVGVGSGFAGAIRTAEAYGSDQSSQVELTGTQLSGAQWVGPTVRVQGGGLGLYVGIYFWNGGAPELRLYKRVGGTFTQLASSINTAPLSAGTKLKLVAVGSRVSFLVNGVERIVVTDGSLTAGAPGLMTYTAARADNWAGADLGSPPPASYSVGGSVSGLAGTVVLQDNGGDDLSVSANGSFAFVTRLATGAAYSVSVRTQPAGQVCTVSGAAGTVASANVTSVAVTCATQPPPPSGFQYVGTDANGVASYNVTVPSNSGTHVMRVLKPTHPTAGVPHNILYVLPVEPELGAVYGDGLEVLRGLDAQNEYNLTIVEPSFGIDPWYADNPNNAGIQYETFVTRDLVPWVTQNLSQSGREQNWLIGFSKSGLGSQDLILKHPDVFTLAASWDFPAGTTAYDQFGSTSANCYGTDANFQANYRLTATFLDSHKGPFLTQNRIWIGGYDGFQTDMTNYDALLTSTGILHSTATPQHMTHRWDSGWVPIALAALRQNSVNLTP